MATEVGSEVANQFKQLIDKDSSSDEKRREEGEKIEPKEFFWDQFLKYISTGIVLLTLLVVSVEFLQGGVTCFTPSVQEVGVKPNTSIQDFSRDQASYINNYCTRNIPTTEFFPIYILIHGVLLIAPHFIWSAVFHGDFDSFFDIARKFDRLRNAKTGEYNPKNFDRVKKLELEYSGKKRNILWSYIAKLFLQLLICIGSIAFSAGFFMDYSSGFKCPTDFSPESAPESWPLDTSVFCVYTNLRLLSLIRFADYILLLLALGLVLLGLGWCFVRHKVELGYEQIARFSFQSCLTSDSFVFPPAIEISFRKLSEACCCTRPCSCGKAFKLRISNLFNPQIRNDLDFLLLRLFRADSSHGRVFKDIQVNKELQSLLGRDHQLLHLYLSVQQTNRLWAGSEGRTVLPAGSVVHDGMMARDLKDFFVDAAFNKNPEEQAHSYFAPYLGNTTRQPVPGIRDRLYGFVRFAPKDAANHPQNGLAVDISFGSVGYSLALARAFRQVISVNFHPFYRDEKESGRKKLFYTNYATITFPEDIFTWSNECINKAGEKVFGSIQETGQKVDFIVVGPLDDERKKSTVTLLIEMMNTARLITEGALLLAIRPLKIAHQKLIGSKAFCKYEPPRKYFDHNYHTGKVENKLAAEIDFSYADKSKTMQGVMPVDCENVACIFEFITYQFIGKYPELPLVCESESDEEPKQVTMVTTATDAVLEALGSFASTLLETCNQRQKLKQHSPSASVSSVSCKERSKARTSNPASSSATREDDLSKDRYVSESIPVARVTSVRSVPNRLLKSQSKPQASMAAVPKNDAQVPQGSNVYT